MADLTTVGLRHQTLVVFAIAFAALFLLQANLFIVANDEGLILEGAQRVLAGQLPYVDFFGHASPGSYWLQAAIFEVFGVSIQSARLGVIADVALLTALLYWFVARYANGAAAVVAAPMFFVFSIVDPAAITIQHRWNSCALSFLSIAMALSGVGKPWWWWTISGSAVAFATLCTPTIGLILILTIAWLVWERPAAMPSKSVRCWTRGGCIACIRLYGGDRDASGWPLRWVPWTFSIYVAQLC